MGYGKQAKILTDEQVNLATQDIRRRSRNPTRDCVMMLMSAKAGLRAIEISKLDWPMVLSAGGTVSTTIALPNRATKGKRGGRYVPMHATLHRWLVALREEVLESGLRLEGPICYSERGERLIPASIVVWFWRLYDRLGFVGCSSHSGRRTFITTAAKKILAAEGSLRDVQALAGHSSIMTTQGYIEADTTAQQRVVAML